MIRQKRKNEVDLCVQDRTIPKRMKPSSVTLASTRTDNTENKSTQDTSNENVKENTWKLPQEVIQYQLFPFLAKNDLMSFIRTCKSHYHLFNKVMERSLNGIRLYYLNFNQNGERNCGASSSLSLDYEHVAREVPMLGDVLIQLLNNHEQIMNHPYLKGIAKDALEWLNELSKMIPSEFEQRLLALTSDSNSNKSVSSVLLPILFEWNRNNPDKQRFFVAGGSVTSAVLDTKWNDTDIDIFVMENGRKPSESHTVLRNLLLQFSENAEKEKIKYAVIKNNGTLNIIDKNKNNAKIQFILRRVCNIEELMVFFDLDCCRFSFDGQNLFTIREGIRSIHLRCNFVPSGHIKSGMYMKRAVKYGGRSIQTFFYTLHPLPTGYYCLSDEVALFEVAQGTKKLKYSKNSGNHQNSADVGLYSPVFDLQFGEVEKICTMGFEKYIKRQADLAHDRGYDRNYYDACWDVFEDLNSTDPHVFAMSLKNMYQQDLSIFFSEGYFESHLRKKYFIVRCYLDRKFEFKPGCFIEEIDDEEEESEDEDEDNEDEIQNVSEESEEKANEDEHENQEGEQIEGEDEDQIEGEEREVYHMCDSCALFNHEKRGITRDLINQVAIVTGARIKIGYHVALKLLRAGATVIATTRFVESARDNYAKEPDYESFKERLILYPLNLKYGNSILAFVDYVRSNFKRIHILINNAAQTVRRPLLYYEQLIEKEREALKLTSNTKDTDEQSSANAVQVYRYDTDLQTIQKIENPMLKAQHLSLFATSTVNLDEEDLKADRSHFPKDELDAFGEPKDLRTHHSWTYKLPEVTDVELLEVQMVNQIAPVMLVSKLMDLMKVSSTDQTTGYIVNVTSHEGSFHTTGKTDSHVHTNISKAALNMLTRSAASHCARHGIIMVSADTGWVSSAISTFKSPPLTCEDGAARILDPVMTNSLEYGVLLKDFRKIPW